MPRNQNTADPIGVSRDVKVAHQTIVHSSDCPSHVILPVIPRCPAPDGDAGQDLDVMALRGGEGDERKSPRFSGRAGRRLLRPDHLRPGAEPDWEGFRALFHRQAVLALRVFPEDDAITVMDLDAYMVKQMRAGMEEEGYSETLVSRTELVFHDVAEVRVVFEMRSAKGRLTPRSTCMAWSGSTCAG